MATCATPFALLADLPRKRSRLTWTEEENRIILSSVRRYGTQWDLVAEQLPGRTADAVRNQCHRMQRSSVSGFDDDTYSEGSSATSSESRKTSSIHSRSVWTAEEDQIVCEGLQSFGCKWRRIAAMLPGRSDSSVRNRWSRLCEGPRAPALTVKPSAPSWTVLAAMCDPKVAPTTQAYYSYILDASTDFKSWRMQQMQMQQMQFQQTIQPPLPKRQCTHLPFPVQQAAIYPLHPTTTPGTLQPGSRFAVVL